MRGPSIRDALNGNLAKEEKVTLREQVASYTGKTMNEQFTKEQLHEKWFEFLQSVQHRPSLKAALSQEPELKQDGILEITVPNSLQQDMVREIKPQLVSWLRMELKNTDIDLDIRIDDSKQEKIIYTDADKFQEMVRKNPALALLKQRFNLDFEG